MADKVPDNILLELASEFYLGPEPLLGGVPYWWEFFSDDQKMHGVHVRNMGSRSEGQPELWAIKGTFGCLNKLGEWEHESMPSHREEDFYERCRYATVHEAIRYYWRWKRAVEEYALQKYLEAGVDLGGLERHQYNHESIRAIQKEKRVVVNYEDVPADLRKFQA